MRRVSKYYNNLLRAPEVPDADQVLCSSLKDWIKVKKYAGFGPSGKITKELSRNHWGTGGTYSADTL